MKQFLFGILVASIAFTGMGLKAIKDGRVILGDFSQGTITTLTVDRIFFEDGGTNSWITMPSATSGVWRINGSNTTFNVELGQE